MRLRRARRSIYALPWGSTWRDLGLDIARRACPASGAHVVWQASHSQYNQELRVKRTNWSILWMCQLVLLHIFRLISRHNQRYFGRVTMKKVAIRVSMLSMSACLVPSVAYADQASTDTSRSNAVEENNGSGEQGPER